MGEREQLMQELNMNKAAQAGQRAYRQTLEKVAGPSGERARLEQELDLGNSHDPDVPAQKPKPLKAIDIEKLEKANIVPEAEEPAAAPLAPGKPAPIERNAIGAPKDPTKVKPVTGAFANAGLGIATAAENIWNFGNMVDDWVAQKVSGPDAQGIMEPSDYFSRIPYSDDPIDGLSRALGQQVLPFMLGAGAVNVMTKGLTAGAKMGAQIAASGAVNFAVANPREEHRFIKTVSDYLPWLKGPLTDWAAADPNDTELEGRFKNAVDALIPDVLLAGIVKAAPAMFKSVRGALGIVEKPIPVTQATAKQQVQELLGETASADGQRLYARELPVEQIVERDIVKESFELQDKVDAKGLPLKVKEAQVDTRDVNINTLVGQQNRDNFLIKEAAQEYVDRVGAEVLRAKTPGMATMDEIDEEAIKIIQNTEEFATLIRGYDPATTKMSREQARAVQLFMTDLYSQADKAYIRAQETGLAIDIAYADQKMTEFVTVTQAALGEASHAGGILGIFSKPTKVSDTTKFKSALKAVEAMGGINEGALRIEQLAQLKKTFKQGAAAKMADAVVKTAGNIGDAIAYVGFTSMTSGLRTTARNFVSGLAVNTLNTITDVNTKFIGLTSKSDNVAMAAKMANARLAAYFGSLRISAAAALHTLETGEVFLPTLYKFEKRAMTPVEQATQLTDRGGAVRSYLTHAVNEVQKGYEFLTTRLTRTADSFNNMFAYQRAMIGEAIQEGTEAGLEGRALEELLDLRLKSPRADQFKRAREVSAEPAMALQYSELFPEDTHALGKWAGQRLSQADSALHASRIGALVAPFLKANVNVIAQGFELMPGLGLLAPRTYAALKTGGVARVEAISKQLMATEMVGLSIWGLHSMGFEITGRGPVDKGTMKALKDTDSGYQPYSLKTPKGEYINLENLGPVSQVFKMIGDYNEISGMLPADQRDRLAMGMVATLGEQLTPQQLTQDLPRFLEAMGEIGPDGDSKAFSKVLLDLGAKVIPASGLLRSMREAIDPNKREVTDATSQWETFKNGFLNTIPGYSLALPPMRNIFGEVVHAPQGYGPDVMSPFFTTQGEEDLSNELRRLGIYNTGVVKMPEGATELEISMPSRVITFNNAGAPGRIELTPEQYDRLVLYSAGVQVPSEALEDADAIDSANITYEDKSRMLSEYMDQDRVRPLREALGIALEKAEQKADERGIEEQLGRDEIKRFAVKAVISDYQKMGRSAMFLDVRNVVEMQRQYENRKRIFKPGE